jgi:succinate dehydrogenase/fumarate reductase-like Fe-S protein
MSTKKDDRRKVRLRVLRQDAPDKPSSRRFEEVEVDLHPSMTVHDCLEAVRRRP